MKKTPSIDRLATLSARQAQSHSAVIQHELRALRDSRTGLSHTLHMPKILAQRGKTKKTTTDSLLTEILGGATIANSIGSGLGISTSFYSSRAQNAAQSLNLFNLAQRNS